MLTKAAAGQVRAVPAQGATSTETTQTVTISPFSIGSQKKAEPGFALKQFHQCWGDRVQHWLGNTAPVTPKSSSLLPTLKCWPKATLQNRACYFPQLKPSCTTRSVLPLSLLLPLGQKEARGLSPYCLDKCLHFGGNDLLSPSSHPWVQDSQHRRMDLPWKVTSPLTHQTGLGHRTAHTVWRGRNFFYTCFFWAGRTLGPEINLLFWTIHASLSIGQMEQWLQWDDRTVVTARRWCKVCKHHSASDAHLFGCQKYCFREIIPNPVTIVPPPGGELGLLISLYHIWLS